MFVPTPCRMPRTVDEQQWDGVGIADAALVDHLKHVGPSNGSDREPARPLFPAKVWSGYLSDRESSDRENSDRENSDRENQIVKA